MQNKINDVSDQANPKKKEAEQLELKAKEIVKLTNGFMDLHATENK